MKNAKFFGEHLNNTRYHVTTPLLAGEHLIYGYQFLSNLAKEYFCKKLKDDSNILRSSNEKQKFFPYGLVIPQSEKAFVVAPKVSDSTYFFSYTAHDNSKITLCSVNPIFTAFFKEELITEQDEMGRVNFFKKKRKEYKIFASGFMGKFSKIRKGIIVFHTPTMNPEMRELIYAELQILFERYKAIYRKGTRKKIVLETIARIHWLHAQSSLHGRGGGWIPETLATALILAAGIDFQKWNKESWGIAVTNTLEGFIKIYPKIFERKASTRRKGI